ncbi:MAG: hypothetical protein KBD31_02210 [Proteobacteria bacterium]|nr:hypothetical protein [Pseudomonadota bacterium]
MKNIVLLFAILTKLSFSAAGLVQSAPASSGFKLNEERKVNTDLKTIDSTVEALKKSPEKYKAYLRKMNEFLKQQINITNPQNLQMPHEKKLAYLRKVNTYLKEQQNILLNPGATPTIIAPIDTSMDDDGIALSATDWRSLRKRLFAEANNSAEASVDAIKSFKKQRSFADGLTNDSAPSNPNDFKLSKRKRSDSLTNDGTPTNPNEFKLSKRQ